MAFKRLISWLAVLPGVAFLGIVPILRILPLYPDELYWRLMTARFFLDRQQLVMLHPVCAHGYLEPAPLSWYPYWVLNSLVYADMSNIYRLRVCGLCISLILVLAVAWLMPRIVQTSYNLAARIGIVLTPLSLGVFPFLLTFNRPEQNLLLVICSAVGLTVLVRSHKPPVSGWTSWGLAVVYALLAAMLIAAHAKGLFLLPALLIAAAAAIRRSLPFLCVLGVAMQSAWTTAVYWQFRLTCPESPFLTQQVRNMSIAPSDMRAGIIPFIRSLEYNLGNAHIYWDHVKFQSEYQSIWLPGAASPTTIERLVNGAMPLEVGIAYLVVLGGSIAAIVLWLRDRQPPSFHTPLALALAAYAPMLAGIQITKNFYEAALIFPVIGLAALFALRPIARIRFAGAVSRVLLLPLILLALTSQFTLATRFYRECARWSSWWARSLINQRTIKTLVEQAGVRADESSSRILMSGSAYPVLWRTREPLFLDYFSGYWGTGVDQERLIRELNVSAIVGSCNMFPEKFRGSGVRDGEFCCVKLAKASR